MTNLHRSIASQTGWLNTSRALTAEDLQGRIILLDFWTFCCINCIHVIPDLQYLEKTFGDDLTVIGVHSAKFKNEQDTANIRSAILRYGIHHPVVNDFDFSIWKSFGVRSWPTFVLINPTGIIEETYSGEGNREDIERDIHALMKQYEGKWNKEKLPMALEEAKVAPSILRFPGKLTAGALERSDIILSDPALVISDSGHHRIVITTLEGYRDGIKESHSLETIGSGTPGFKDGNFVEAQFNTPQGVLYFDSKIYVADTNNHALRLIDLKARTVTTLAGTGKQGYVRSAKNASALETPLASPWDLAFYPDENHIAIAMAGTHQLWSYDIENKTVSVIAGNGRESIDDGRYPFNSLSQPSGLAAHEGKLYFIDSETSSLRVLENGVVTTLIGTGLFDFGYKEGKQGQALMQHPLGLYADEAGVYITDSYNHSIRRFDPATGVLSNFAGHGERGNKDGAAMQAEFNEPNDILKIGEKFFVADTNNNAIRVIDGTAVSTLAIQEPAKTDAVEYSEQLPNAETLPAASVAPAASIALTLAKGWHINDEAPSYLALFDAQKKPVASFGLAAVKTNALALPSLPEGSYRLQATLYYCEDKEGAQCLIKSFDVELRVKDGGVKKMVLKVN